MTLNEKDDQTHINDHIERKITNSVRSRYTSLELIEPISGAYF